jgi:voltage-gated potassium channel
MLIALVASVPAFYDSMMPTLATWATWMYVVSGLVVLSSAWYARHHTQVSPTMREHSGVWGAQKSQERLDWFLGVALLLNAVLPQSNVSQAALIWRLIVAVLMLYRLFKISMPLLTETGLARLLALAATVLGLCGVGFYWLDPEVNSLTDGLWLAFSTAATVGYGDVVPSTTASRIFSVFVVLLGYGVLSLVTASVAAMFVGTQERKVEREILRDLHAQLKEVRHEISTLRHSIEKFQAHQPAGGLANSHDGAQATDSTRGHHEAKS